jgi:hypothetical protein
MTGNKIGNKGGMWFAQALQVNKGLEALDVADTDLVSINKVYMEYLVVSCKTVSSLSLLQ